MTLINGKEHSVTNRLRFRNGLDHAIEVMVEVNPDRYVLRPNDEITVIAKEDDEFAGAGFALATSKDCLQIYAAIDGQPSVLINGERVDPDWDTPIP